MTTSTSLANYAVLGHPIHHSMSPQIHAAFATQTGHELRYTAIDVAPADLGTTLVRLPHEGFRGVNITVPHKEAAWSYAQQHGTLSERAAMAGAVNTLAWTADGLIGDNTDGQGLLNDLEQRHGLSLTNKRILLLGAGGATRGVVLPLLATKPATLMIANRTASRANDLANLFTPKAVDAGCLLHGCGLDALGDIIGTTGAFDIVINATSASLGGEAIQLPTGTITSDGFAYDMMYGKALTPFLSAQSGAGVSHLADGLGMLVEQAAVAFEIWRGVRPDTQPVYEALREQLARK
ncbi:MAG: shikimate dehydrogenase [Rhodocyclales bacterium]|nr:shikimate dehydrogenase [Rhodocyclales bacterium]